MIPDAKTDREYEAYAKAGHLLRTMGISPNTTQSQAVVIDTLLTGLQQIVDRSNDGELGTSKVIDMRNIALALLAQHGGAA